MLITATGLLFSLYWEVVEGVLSGAEGPASLVGLLGSLFASLIGLLFVIPLYVGFLFAAVAIVHVGFLVVRSGRRGYEGTFRAFTYAAGPGAFALFPFFGPGLSAVWGMVLIYIAVREIQRTTNARAALAFLVPLLGLMAFVVFLAAVFELLLRTTEFGQPL